MKAILQRVKSASVSVDGKETGSCGAGLFILLGVEDGDGEADALFLAEKISKLRIFEDGNGKMNLSVNDIGGTALVVSNFTLCADCSHGNRPSFTGAAAPACAKELYEKFTGLLRKRIAGVECGVFGADMEISALCDGPVTISLCSRV